MKKLAFNIKETKVCLEKYKLSRVNYNEKSFNCEITIKKLKH